MNRTADVDEDARQPRCLCGAPHRTSRITDSVDALSEPGDIDTQRPLTATAARWATEMSLVNATDLQETFAIKILQLFAPKPLPSAPFADSFIRTAVVQIEFMSASHNSANRVILEILPNPSSQLHVIFVKVAAE